MGKDQQNQEFTENNKSLCSLCGKMLVLISVRVSKAVPFDLLEIDPVSDSVCLYLGYVCIWFSCLSENLEKTPPQKNDLITSS